MDRYVVAIDGPSGVGKTSVSRGVAEHLACAHLDTGAFYRAATVVAIVNRVRLDIEAEVLAAVAAAELAFEAGSMRIGGVPMDDAIRSADVTAAVSRVAAYPSVRSVLVDRQRSWVEEHGGRAVVEGRDIGTVVFVDAPLKIFLEAREEVRAARRAGETPRAAVGDVQADLNRRDRADSSRAASPLVVAEDAVVIDTSDLDRDAVTARVIELATERGITPVG